MGHLEKFLQKRYRLSDIPFKALDKSFIENFDFHLCIESGYAVGTIIEITTRLRIIVNYAICEGIITYDPFAGYTLERPCAKQKYLTSRELDKLMTTPLENPNHYLIRDLFLFSCYTGMAYNDMRKLTDDDLTAAEDGWFGSGLPARGPEIPAKSRCWNFPCKSSKDTGKRRRKDGCCRCSATRP
jgi:hypothetical protein